MVGFSGFTVLLSLSPWQSHGMINTFRRFLFCCNIPRTKKLTLFPFIDGFCIQNTHHFSVNWIYMDFNALRMALTRIATITNTFVVDVSIFSIESIVYQWRKMWPSTRCQPDLHSSSQVVNSQTHATSMVDQMVSQSFAALNTSTDPNHNTRSVGKLITAMINTNQTVQRADTNSILSEGHWINQLSNGLNDADLSSFERQSTYPFVNHISSGDVL